MSDSSTDFADLRAVPRFWRIFSRVLGESMNPANYLAVDLAQWDSLRHVELIFEIEEQFDIDITPEQIVALYTDTDTILAYLKQHGRG